MTTATNPAATHRIHLGAAGGVYLVTDKPCPRCGGAGVIARHAGIDGGRCFGCGGCGKIVKDVPPGGHACARAIAAGKGNSLAWAGVLAAVAAR